MLFLMSACEWCENERKMYILIISRHVHPPPKICEKQTNGDHLSRYRTGSIGGSLAKTRVDCTVCVGVTLKCLKERR